MLQLYVAGWMISLRGSSIQSAFQQRIIQPNSDKTPWPMANGQSELEINTSKLHEIIIGCSFAFSCLEG